METATILGKCPSCGEAYELRQSWTPGGVNDYGGFVLKCTNCGTVFAQDIGRDVNDSSALSGVTVIERWDRDIVGDEAAVKARHGL